MNDDQVVMILGQIKASQQLNEFQEAAWASVLVDVDFDEAQIRLVDAYKSHRFVLPEHVADAEVDSIPWGEAWAVVCRLFPRIGADGDYGSPAINAAVMACRRAIREQPADKAQWAFRAAYEGELAGTTAAIDAARGLVAGEADPELESGV